MGLSHALPPALKKGGPQPPNAKGALDLGTSWAREPQDPPAPSGGAGTLWNRTHTQSSRAEALSSLPHSWGSSSSQNPPVDMWPPGGLTPDPPGFRLVQGEHPMPF